MNTTRCSDCNGLVSKQAKACPHCGAPVNRAGSSSGEGGCLLACLIVGGLLFWGFKSGKPSPPAPGAQTTQRSEEEIDQRIKQNMGTYETARQLMKVSVVDHLTIYYDNGLWTATLTVKNIWHLRHKQLRLQDAQTLWDTWAHVASPKDLSRSRIKLVDYKGNE